ncbi:hypothetical protein [Saccharopolyspora pogona]|uniref:hypothetical protein n=1 Tax=Saccharopolyspora pogona TaxID=333966 RepID=UPI00168255FD|nr:hypothetical protein [Saccharopolyspora pogona]
MTARRMHNVAPVQRGPDRVIRDEVSNLMAPEPDGVATRVGNLADLDRFRTRELGALPGRVDGIVSAQRVQQARHARRARENGDLLTLAPFEHVTAWCGQRARLAELVSGDRVGVNLRRAA